MSWTAVGWGLAAAFSLGYLLLFFASPAHRAMLWAFLVPDEWLRQWAGGSWDRVGIGDRFPIFVLAGLVQLSMLGYGFVTMILLGWPSAKLGTRLRHWPLAAALGWGVHQTVLLAAGWLGLLHARSAAWIAMLFGGLLASVAVWQGSQAVRIRRWWKEGSSWPQLGGLVLLVAWSVYLSLAAALPPRDFDVREYHLQVPKEWYQQGRVTFMSHNIYGNMPLGAEMAALECMVLWGGKDGWWWGALCGKVLMAWGTLWCAVWLGAEAQKRWKGAAGVVAAGLYATAPGITHVSLAGLNEGVLAFYYFGVVAMVVAAMEQRHSPNVAARAWRTAAVLAGFAASVKYPAVVFVTLPVVVTAGVMAWREGHAWRSILSRVTGVALLVVAAGGIWYVKNAVVSGNPVYPLAAQWLDGRTRTPERIAQWERAHQVPRDEQGRRYSPRQWFEALATFGYRSDRLAPGLIPLALVGTWWCWRRWEVRVAAAVLIFWWLLWFAATHRIERFYLPFWPLLAFLGASLWHRPWKRVGRVVPTALLVVSLAYGVVAGVSRFCGDNRVLVRLSELRDDEPHPADPDMPRRTNPVHVWLNRQAEFAEGEAVLLVGDAQPFDLERPVYYNTCFDATWLERWLSGRTTRRERQEALRRRRIRYVVVDWDEIARYRATYGYSPFVTRSLIDGELWRRQRVLRKLESPTDRHVELFEVR